MKKLLFFLTIIMLSSCKISLEESRIDNPEKATTIAIQKNVIDSCAVLCTDGNFIYIMKDNKVQYQLSPLDEDHEIVSNVYMFFTVLLMVFILFIILILITKKQK